MLLNVVSTTAALIYVHILVFFITENDYLAPSAQLLHFGVKNTALVNTCISNVVYVVVVVIIIIIRHELDLNGPVSASSNRHLKRLLSRLRPFGL